jgi:hypothetical protein
MRCDYCGWINPKGAERCVKCNQILPEEVVEPEAKIEVVEQEPIVRSSSDSRATVIFKNNSHNEVSPNPSSNLICCPECGYPISDDAATECINCGFSLKPAKVESPAPVASSNNAMKQTIMDVNTVISNMEPAPKKVDTKCTIMDVNAVVAPEATDMNRTVMDFGARNSNKNAMKQTILDVSSIEIPQYEPQPSNASTSVCRLHPLENFDGKAKAVQLEQEKVVLNRANLDPENPTIDASEHACLMQKGGEWYIKNLSSSQRVYISSSREIKLESGDIVVIGNKRFIFQ